MMLPELTIEKAKTDALIPYAGNAKKHGAKDIAAIEESINQFGFNDPVGVWTNPQGELEIVEGHGRVLAAKNLGIEEISIIRLDHLDDDQRRAYVHVHNQTTLNTGFDFEKLNREMEKLKRFDFKDFGFGWNDDWFASRERDDASEQEGNEEYNDFLKKFEAKKTTDDCYTPDIVYDAIAEWVAKEYGLKRAQFVRPFYPNGDYQKEKYAEDAVVVDNPPFSIMAEILRWYMEHQIRFFLFAPTMTLFSSAGTTQACCLPCGGKITYENGAIVATSFVTNLEDYRVRVVPELYKIVEAADAENQAQFKKTLPKYKYPDEVLTATMCRYMCEHDTPLTIRREDSYHIRQLESQKEYNDSTIFGSGFLLSGKAAAEKAAAEKAAAEKAAAEKAAAHIWELSEREREIVRSLG